MTIEHTDLTAVLGDTDTADLEACAAHVHESLAAVQKNHGAYNWLWTDEIACRGCGARLEIPFLRSNNIEADRALERHQQEQLQRLLNANPW